MLLEDYVKQTQDTIEKTLTMYSKMESTAEGISLDFLQDGDSIESDIDTSTADTSNLIISIDKSREKLKELSLGLTQIMERYANLKDIVDRRKNKLEQLNYIQIATIESKVELDEDAEIRKTYAPLFAGLTEAEIQNRIAEIKRMRGIK